MSDVMQRGKADIGRGGFLQASAALGLTTTGLPSRQLWPISGGRGAADLSQLDGVQQLATGLEACHAMMDRHLFFSRTHGEASGPVALDSEGVKGVEPDEAGTLRMIEASVSYVRTLGDWA